MGPLHVFAQFKGPRQSAGVRLAPMWLSLKGIPGPSP